MRANSKRTILLLGSLLMLALVACGSENNNRALASNPEPTPVLAEIPTTNDGRFTDADVQAAVAAALAEHDLTPHPNMIEEDHEEEASEAAGHGHEEGTVDPDAPVVHIFASEFSYDTETTVVEAGHGFTVMLHNEGVLEHDITFEGLEDQGGIHLQPGEDSMATFTITEPGEYTYYCTVPGHREAGMTGLLTVAADDQGDVLMEATHDDEDAVDDDHKDDHGTDTA